MSLPIMTQTEIKKSANCCNDEIKCVYLHKIANKNIITASSSNDLWI